MWCGSRNPADMVDRPPRIALRFALALGLVGGLILGAAAPVRAAEEAAATEAQEDGDQKITLSYRRVPLVRVLDRLSRAAGGINIKVQVEDDDELKEAERAVVTLELNQVSWRTALEVLARKYRYVINNSMEEQGVILLERPPRVTMNVQAAPIENVIKLIAADAHANIIIGPEVQGTVTFAIHDVPWKEALDSILKTHGFIKVEDKSGVIRITTPEKVQQQLEVRVFVLRYVAPAGVSYRAKVESDYVERVEGTGQANEFSLLQVLGNVKSEQGTISYEQRTNQVIVKDTATKLEEMAQVIRQIDRPPLQVHIQARLLSKDQGSDNSGTDIGVDWNQGFTSSINGGSWATTFPYAVDSGRNSKNAFGSLGPWSAAKHWTNDTLAPWPALNDLPNNNPYGTPYINYTTDGVATGDYTLGTMNMTALQATLQLVSRDDSIDLIQAPEIVAMDNEEATIHIGDVIRYAEFYTETTDGGTVSGYREHSPPVVSGVQLLVVPHVIPEVDQVMLTVVPKTETLKGWEVFGQGTANELRLPQTNSKVVVTRMMLENQETGVIAGLMSNQENYDVRKVPVLGDMPIFGYLFKRESTNNIKRNVIMLITPSIIKPSHRQEFEEKLMATRRVVELDGSLEELDR